MTTQVRPAVPDDLNTLLELVEEYCDADPHPFDRAVARAGLEPLLADESRGVVWLIDPDPETGGADGYAVVTWGWSIEIGGFEVVLDELYVRSRGQGKGSDALRVIEDDCRGRGVKRIFLETEMPNEAARRFYGRHDFVADSSIWMWKELC